MSVRRILRIGSRLECGGGTGEWVVRGITQTVHPDRGSSGNDSGSGHCTLNRSHRRTGIGT